MESQYLKGRRARMMGIKEKEPPKEKKGLKQVSDKRRQNQEQDKVLSMLDKAFYMEHWASCPHECEACKKRLGNKPLAIFFHHALFKRHYPEFRHVNENIIVLCPDCHSQVEHGLNIPYVKKRTEQIRKLLLK